MTSTYELMWMVVVLCGESGMRTRSIVLVWVTVNTVWSRLEMWLWSNLEIRKWQLRGSRFFYDEHVAWICGLWISALSNFLHRISFSIGSWHVGSSGGHRRAVTSGHRKGPGSN